MDTLGQTAAMSHDKKLSMADLIKLLKSLPTEKGYGIIDKELLLIKQKALLPKNPWN